jgi:hypothetical protein
MVYREANAFLEAKAGGLERGWKENERSKKALADMDWKDRDLDAELEAQLQPLLSSCDSLEDLVKYSLLKEPPSVLWRTEERWAGVLVGVAMACLTHDVKGVAQQIASGRLPRVPTDNIAKNDNAEK